MEDTLQGTDISFEGTGWLQLATNTAINKYFKFFKLTAAAAASFSPVEGRIVGLPTVVCRGTGSQERSHGKEDYDGKVR